MANAAPNQNGSQFFIAISDLTGRIPNDYPVFAQVTRGMEVVQTISNGAVVANSSGEQSKPVDPSILLNISILATGDQSGAPAGPVVIGPTPTTVAVPTAQPTAVPPAATATTGAQARPGSQSASTTATQPPATGGSGCEGLEDYQSAFDDAYFNTALQMATRLPS